MLLNFLNELVHLFGTAHYQFWGYQDYNLNSIEPSQTAQIGRLAWPYTGDKDYLLSPLREGLKCT